MISANFAVSSENIRQRIKLHRKSFSLIEKKSLKKKYSFFFLEKENYRKKLNKPIDPNWLMATEHDYSLHS